MAIRYRAVIMAPMVIEFETEAEGKHLARDVLTGAMQEVSHCRSGDKDSDKVYPPTILEIIRQ